MTRTPPSAQAFFLEAKTGQRFCLFHPPAPGRYRGALLYVHPFGDEMNRSRRMAALQSRALAALGYGVLQIDLHGCGDSGGEFADARWEGWHDDLAAGSDWLAAHSPGPLSLLGLRLGALLALDYAGSERHQFARLVLWQPVLSGAAYLTQLLRLRLAGSMLAAGDAGGGTKALRARLAAGETLEIGGYELAPALAEAIGRLEAAALALPACPLYWFEVVPAATPGVPLAAERVGGAWRARGAAPQLQAVAGPPFWSTPELSECPALLAATAALFAEERS